MLGGALNRSPLFPVHEGQVSMASHTSVPTVRVIERLSEGASLIIHLQTAIIIKQQKENTLRQ